MLILMSRKQPTTFESLCQLMNSAEVVYYGGVL